MFQPNLLFSQNISHKYLKKLELLFSGIPKIEFPYSTGRHPHSFNAMLNALIFKNLKGITFLADLSSEFLYHSAVAQVCEFKSFPHRERFSSFLKDTPNEFLQNNISTYRGRCVLSVLI